MTWLPARLTLQPERILYLTSQGERLLPTGGQARNTTARHPASARSTSAPSGLDSSHAMRLSLQWEDETQGRCDLWRVQICAVRSPSLVRNLRLAVSERIHAPWALEPLACEAV